MEQVEAFHIGVGGHEPRGKRVAGLILCGEEDRVAGSAEVARELAAGEVGDDAAVEQALADLRPAGEAGDLAQRDSVLPGPFDRDGLDLAEGDQHRRRLDRRLRAG